MLDGQAPNGDIPYCRVMKKLALLRTSKTNKHFIRQKEKHGKGLFQLEMANVIPQEADIRLVAQDRQQVRWLTSGMTTLVFGHFTG